MALNEIREQLENIRETVLGEMEKNPGDCNLFLKLFMHIAKDSPIGDGEYGVATGRMLITLHKEACTDFETKHKAFDSFRW